MQLYILSNYYIHTMECKCCGCNMEDFFYYDEGVWGLLCPHCGFEVK